MYFSNEFCGLCGEEVYHGMLERHIAKDHNTEDDAIFKLAEKLQGAAAKEGFTLTTSRSLAVSQYLMGDIGESELY